MGQNTADAFTILCHVLNYHFQESCKEAPINPIIANNNVPSEVYDYLENTILPKLVNETAYPSSFGYKRLSTILEAIFKCEINLKLIINDIKLKNLQTRPGGYLADGFLDDNRMSAYFSSVHGAFDINEKLANIIKPQVKRSNSRAYVVFVTKVKQVYKTFYDAVYNETKQLFNPDNDDLVERFILHCFDFDREFYKQIIDVPPRINYFISPPATVTPQVVSVGKPSDPIWPCKPVWKSDQQTSIKKESKLLIASGQSLFQGAYATTGLMQSGREFEIQACWVNDTSSLGTKVNDYVTKIKAVPMIPRQFYHACAVLQSEEHTLAGQTTDLSDLPLFEPVLMYIKGPSTYAGTTVCRLEGWAVPTAAYHSSVEMITQACTAYCEEREHHAVTKVIDQLEAYFKVTGQYQDPDEAKIKALNPDAGGAEGGTAKEYIKTLRPVSIHTNQEKIESLVQAMRLATRVLRGTRAQISDIHGRRTAINEFNECVAFLCDKFKT